MWGPESLASRTCAPHTHAAPHPGPTGGAQDGGWLPLLHPGQCPCSSVNFRQLSQITPLLKHLKTLQQLPTNQGRPWAHGRPSHLSTPQAWSARTSQLTWALPSPGRVPTSSIPSPSGLGSEPPPRDPALCPRCHCEVEAER